MWTSDRDPSTAVVTPSRHHPPKRRTAMVVFVLVATTVVAWKGSAPAEAAPLHQAGGWTAQHSGTSQTLRDVEAIDKNVVWAIGGEGGEDCIIVRTDDSGATWRRQACPIDAKLLAMSGVSRTDAWIVGVNGVAMHTADGQGWSVVDVGTTQVLTDVWFADSRHGWICTRNGLILRTSDGGAHWQTTPSGAVLGLFGVHFLDAQRGWVVGSGGTVLRTSDGGGSWTKLPPFSDARILAVRFLDDNRGFGAGNVLLQTEDGGQNWTPKFKKLPKTINDVTFADASNGWAVGDEGYMLHSTDGGSSWPETSNNSNVSLTAIDFVDPALGWTVGTEGRIFRWGAPQPDAPPTAVPTLPPPTVPPSPTVTPAPTFTPTPLPTPTPSGPWVAIAPGAPLFAAVPGQARPVRIAFGNQPAAAILTATLVGPVRFPDAQTTVTRSLATSSGEMQLTLVTPEDVGSGTSFDLRVDVGGAAANRNGRVPHAVALPLLWRRR